MSLKFYLDIASITPPIHWPHKSNKFWGDLDHISRKAFAIIVRLHPNSGDAFTCSFTIVDEATREGFRFQGDLVKLDPPVFSQWGGGTLVHHKYKVTSLGWDLTR